MLQVKRLPRTTRKKKMRKEVRKTYGIREKQKTREKEMRRTWRTKER
jgi:hypothetical protein